MQRTHDRDAGAAAAARDATTSAAATVAPLLQLCHAATKARNIMREARAAELFERALAAADAALPRDSLIIADLLRAVTVEYARLGRDARGGVSCKATLAAIWREDPQLLVAARRALDILRARWCAGSLFNFTPEEEAFFGESDTTFHHEHWDIKGTGADLYITCAAQTLDCWPPPSTRADEMARLHDIHNALRAALQLCAPLLGVGGSRCFAFPPHTLAMLHSLTARLDRGILHPLRCDCGLTLVDETALHRLAPMVNRSIGEVDRQFAEDDAACAKAAAADVARHGLRRCALPSCNATEPHPKRYTLCGRCRGVAYRLQRCALGGGLDAPQARGRLRCRALKRRCTLLVT
jgi:hypothetical protein